MILYVINLLYDNLKKKVDISNKDYLRNSIVKDAGYIADFAGIKQNTDIIAINSGLIKILDIIKKYGVSTVDTLDILQIILGSKNNNWIIRRCFEESLDNNSSEIVLTSIVNDILKRDKNGVLENLENLSDDLRMLILKTIFGKIKAENERDILIEKLHDAS
ncbi:hypothetical protein [Clostridium sp. SM-530-WT-3G]|uniref:hypothetical protein n=1 Tax=Clostridium sp. SM-530-WT-3G TaxID=2725303 RepID=UPI00145F9629|nr:hypothetical protein [Clostridium sp. SM-530-WT-3G]NME82571.1 hypothetical protein [Clostridium sp. SM-530-WT-3G]